MIDRDFEQVSEEHMKSMTKPEGPAQEPQVTFEKIDVCPFCFARYTIGPVSGRCYKCDKFIEPVPATPAPHEEKLTFAVISNRLRRLAKGNNLWFDLEAYAEHIDALAEEAAQQTAAKDALCERVQKQRDELVTENRALRVAKEAAARERDSLRAENEKLKRQAEGECDGCGEPLEDAYCTRCARSGTVR